MDSTITWADHIRTKLANTWIRLSHLYPLILYWPTAVIVVPQFELKLNKSGKVKDKVVMGKAVSVCGLNPELGCSRWIGRPRSEEWRQVPAGSSWIPCSCGLGPDANLGLWRLLWRTTHRTQHCSRPRHRVRGGEHERPVTMNILGLRRYLWSQGISG